MIEEISLAARAAMTHQATLQRDQAVRDAGGAKGRRDWQPLSTVECFLWWGTGAVISRQGSIHERPEETVDLELGGMIFPAGTDVSPRDRVEQVVDQNGNQIAGLLEILSVGPFEGVTEVMVRRIT